MASMAKKPVMVSKRPVARPEAVPWTTAGLPLGASSHEQRLRSECASAIASMEHRVHEDNTTE